MSGPTPVAAAVAHVAGQVRDRWADAVCGRPVSFGMRSLGAPRADRDVDDVGAFQAWRAEWEAFAREHASRDGVTVTHRDVSLGRIAYPAPASLRCADLDAAVAVAGGESAATAARGRAVHARLAPAAASVTPALLRRAAALADVDLDVLVGVLDWIRRTDDLGAFSARQVPVAGAHSKWCERHGPLVATLAGRDLARELAPRPAHVAFTYLDPDHRAAGGRWHDSWTTGDAARPAYAPDVVVVVENRDSRLFFPPLAGAIAVEGGGTAAGTLARVPWVATAPHLLYWGDLDAWGLAILDRLRGTLDRQVTSVLMDRRALDAYRHLGVDRHPDGRPIEPRRARLANLTGPERAAYAAVCDRASGAPPRIEQERIPLADARQRVVEELGRDR